MFRILRCGNNNAIDHRSNQPATCFGNTNDVIIYTTDVTTKEAKNDIQPQPPKKEQSELDKLIDMIEASETASETDDDAEDADWDISCLLGEALLTNYSPDSVDAKSALYGKAVVLLYFGGGDANILDKLKLFDAGYHHTVLSVVYCHDDLSAFVDMPARWFAALNVAELSASLGKDAEENCVMVLDPKSGDVLSDNALKDILALDTSNESIYDDQATELFQSWIEHLPLKLSVIGEMTFEFQQAAVFVPEEASGNDSLSVESERPKSRIDYV